MKKISALIVVAATLCAGSALAAGDAAKGKRVFNKCKACHSLEAGKHRIGPSLHGVFGREAGTVSGFKFSKAMKDSKVVWSPETLAKYLEKPRDFIKGTRMVFPGLRKEKEREDLNAFLMEATKAK